jgi:type IV pilus assembly protein PilM
MVVISLGTDSTDLVVTNGYRVWQRKVPIGGNHFTKALTKELRLTFAKAEQTKRNATKSENPKAVFQAMRPIFSDLVTEIQRSIGYFTSLDRNAQIEGVVALGNALKLPGLHRYLSDNLKQDVQTVKAFRALEGDAVVGDPRFQENLMSFGVCYGLCLQGLGRAKISTNLLPQEIVTQRLIREKKPWAVAGVAALLAGCAINFVSHVFAWHSANIQMREDFQSAISQAESVKRISSDLMAKNKDAVSEFERIDAIGKNLVSNVEGRLLWLELFKAIDAALPREDPQQKREKIGDRRELHIQSVECQAFEDLATWYQGIEKAHQEDYRAIYGRSPGESVPQGDAAAVTPASAPPAASPSSDGAEPSAAKPAGPGRVIELRGYHYHNEDTNEQGPTFVRNTLLKNLYESRVKLPDGPGGELVEVPIQDLGIGYPVIVFKSAISKPQFLVDPSAAPGGVSPRTPEALGGKAPPASVVARSERTDGGDAPLQPVGQEVKRFDFVVQFCWAETPHSKRREIARARAEAARAAAEVASQTNDAHSAPANNPPGGA